MATFTLKKRGFEAKLRRQRAVLPTILPTEETLRIEGADHSRDAILAAFDQTLARFEAVRQAKVAWQIALRTLHADLAAGTHALVRDLPRFVRYRFGNHAKETHAFGAVEKPRRKLSPAEKAVANALMVQTRKDRRILGKRQRAAISATPKPQLVITLPDPKKKK